jgi:hypothetical protein
MIIKQKTEFTKSQTELLVITKNRSRAILLYP